MFGRAYFRKRLAAAELARMIWKVSNRDLVWLNDKSHQSKTLDSLPLSNSIANEGNKDTNEAMDGDKARVCTQLLCILQPKEIYVIDRARLRHSVLDARTQN